MQQTYYDINNYITTTMRDELKSVTIKKDGTQIYHSSTIYCSETDRDVILTVRTELFLDSDSAKSSVAVTIFIESEDASYRYDASFNNICSAITFISSFINMKVVQHR